MLVATYSSRLKYNVFTMLNSVTLNDWRYLSGREYSGDDYVEGDILRLTGNLMGRSAGYVMKKVSYGIGDGVSSISGSIGNEIQRSSERVGAGAVGASVNSVVTGLGDGVGSSIKGGKFFPSWRIRSNFCSSTQHSRIKCAHLPDWCLSPTQVGAGSGKLFRGAGKGLGQVVGGGEYNVGLRSMEQL